MSSRARRTISSQLSGSSTSTSTGDLFKPADNDNLLALARYLVRCAFRESLTNQSREEIAVIIMGMARCIAIELLEENGMGREQARKFVTRYSRMLEHMTDQMAKEAGLM